MVTSGFSGTEIGRPGQDGGGSEPDRLARRDQLILRLEVARRRRRLALQAADRLRPALLARLSG
jgi:hypothetical protein